MPPSSAARGPATQPRTRSSTLSVQARDSSGSSVSVTRSKRSRASSSSSRSVTCAGCTGLPFSVPATVIVSSPSSSRSFTGVSVNGAAPALMSFGMVTAKGATSS